MVNLAISEVRDHELQQEASGVSKWSELFIYSSSSKRRPDIQANSLLTAAHRSNPQPGHTETRPGARLFETRTKTLDYPNMVPRVFHKSFKVQGLLSHGCPK